MSYYHTHWRDLDAWKKEGIFFSSPSNQAVKLYDGALSQMIQYYECPSLDSLEKTIGGIIQADPNFVMGHILQSGMPLIHVDLDTNPSIKKEYDFIMDLVDKEKLTEHEKKHALAYQQCYHGNTIEACDIWEDILVNCPRDMLALKMLQETCILNGTYPRLRDAVAGVIPHWKPETPLQPYLYGMQAFSLEETGRFQEAEKYAKKGLELMPIDCWATHARAHIFQEMGRHNEGIKFMNETSKDWDNPSGLTGHNYWHLALYHVEKGDHETALSIFDQELDKRFESANTFELTNGASLLHRLEVEGVHVGDRWNKLVNTYSGLVDTHIWMFIDVHLMMCALGAKDENLSIKLLKSLKDYARDFTGSNAKATRDLGIALCEAFLLADEGKFDEAVELLKPLRYEIYRLGGSNAQQDVFRLFLINAAMMSCREDHQKFARRLLAERKLGKESSPLTERLASRVMANH